MACLYRIIPLLLLLFVLCCFGDRCPKRCRCSHVKYKDGGIKVDCRGKGITEIYPQDAFPSNMRILDLSRNNISTLKLGFLDLHFKLERLYLRQNFIKDLEVRAFVGLDNLKRLNMKQNKLAKLHQDAFSGLAKLDFLDLTDNGIRSIDKHAFRGLNSLTKLILKNNTFTSILNGTFEELSSLKKIDMKDVPLTCDCRLNPFMKYLATPRAPRVSGKCSGSSEKLMTLKGTNLCEKPSVVFVNPSDDQIVAVGDRFKITCSATTKRALTLYWTKNQRQLPKKVKVTKAVEGKKKLSYVKFDSIRSEDAGTYKCFANDRSVKPREIVLRVITSKQYMCSRDVMTIHDERFLWPVTVERTTAVASCPWPNDQIKNVDTNIQRTCTEKGVWGPVIFGKCQFISLSSKLTFLAKELKKSNDAASVANKLKLVTSYSSSYQTAENITLLFSVFAGIMQKYSVPFRGQFLNDMLASFNNVMDVNSKTLFAAQRKDRSPSRLGARLELITRGIANETSTRVMSNIVIGSVTLKKSRSNKHVMCTVYFRSNSRPGGMECQQHTTSSSKDDAVAIQIPNSIFQSLQAAGHSMDSLRLQFLVYRNAKLFPHVISNKTEDVMKDRKISSSVLGIQMANIKELNLTDPLIIHFATQPGTDPIISHFDFAEEVLGKSWSQNTDCMVQDSNASMTTLECRRLVNKNLAIMSHLGITNVVIYPMKIVVYLGAVLASVCLIATLVTFALARSVRYNRDDVIMLMNACLSLTVVILSFAFGINRTENSIVCQAMGMSLHFFFFASLLWLGSFVACVTRRLMPRKDAEEVFNPVLMYYMVSWGVPAIVCGMTLASDMRNYKTADYCWLTGSAGLGAFVGPACLLFIINAVLLVRLHLLLARGTIDRRRSEENTEEQRLQTDEPGVLEEVPDPSPSLNAEKSSITLQLVATWVVMSLIYLNFILAYFLVNSRTSKVRWIILSYVYALANITLAAAIFGFHCVARPEVRKAWSLAWKHMRTMTVNCGPCRTLWISKKKETVQINGRILLNGEDITHRIESDRQSNITLPSSAALTNDVFVDGRPLSTARVSLLEEADFPPEESLHGGAVDNEVDITEMAGGEESRSVHSEKQCKIQEEAQSIADQGDGTTNLLPVPADEDFQAEITDGVTSKSESSAPTAIEVSQPSRPDSPVAELPRIVPPSGMVHPFMANEIRQFPPYPNQAMPMHQFRPVFQAPFAHHFIMPPHRALAHQGHPTHPSPTVCQAPPGHPGQPAQPIPPVRQAASEHQTPPAHRGLIEAAPPNYQAVLEQMTSQSGSSACDNAAVSRSNSKRKRNSNESLGSRNESGSVGPRARKLPQLQTMAPAISEVPTANGPSEATNVRNAAQNLGTIVSTRPRYRDGREKPEPKQWNGTSLNRIAYVAVPHVSKIHREPFHNETSV